MAGYGKEYYDNYTGIAYENDQQWQPLFKRFAQHIADDFAPKKVLDIGCAYGYVVKYLRELGVEAWGIDTSAYALKQADESIKPYLRLSSATEPLPEDIPQHYDLVLNIEVLEHLYPEDGMNAICRMCSYADDILFSSTGEDYENPSHINVQQPEYWAGLFAKQGFYKDLLYNMDYLSKYAAHFTKKQCSNEQVISDYERALRYEKYLYANEQATSSRLAKDVDLLREQGTKDTQYFRGEIERLTQEAKQYISDLESAGNKAYNLQKEYDNSLAETADLKNTLAEAQSEVQSCRQQLHDDAQAIKDLQADILQITKEKQNNIADNRRLYSELSKSLKNVEKLERQLADNQSAVNNISDERDVYLHSMRYYQGQLESIVSSRGYRALTKYYKVRDWLLPKGTLRRKFVKRLSRIYKKKPVNVIAPEQISSAETKIVEEPFYNVQEIMRQNWCRQHPLQETVKFSIVVPVYNTPLDVLQAMIFSVKDQVYANWELCIADASNNGDDIANLVSQLMLDCEKIKYLKLSENKGISGNTEEAIRMASGEYIALLDHDDLIAPNALYEYAYCLEQGEDIDFFYCDKDMIDEAGKHRMNPLYKPAYSPEMMYSANYLTHFCVIKKSIFEQTSGFDSKADGAQDWDIFLKIMAKTSKFKHIDRILYHWRVLSTSVASGVDAKPYALDAQIYSLQQYVNSMGWPADVYFADKGKSMIKVDWHFKVQPSVKLVVIADDIHKQNLNLPKGYEVVYVDRYDADLKSKLVNIEADVLIFIDGDVCRDFSGSLVEELASWALHPEVGFVAPQLRYEGKIFSCGLVFDDEQMFDMYKDHDYEFYGQMGSCKWYRNFSCFRSVCLAIEQKKFAEICGYKPTYGSLALSYNCFALMNAGLRNVYDHYAWLEADAANAPDQVELSNDFKAIECCMDISAKDQFFNSNCYIDINRTVSPEGTKANIAPALPLDKYTTDALALAATFDFSLDDLQKNSVVIHNNYEGNVRSIIWFLQEFDYVFYAGLYTIFRTASYLQTKHNIKNIFVFVANTSAKTMMERVAAGFPELGQCKAYSITSMAEMSMLPTADAGICTLWTTAYYLLKFNKVKRKFYFIQDYEPLFYPAGSTYAQAEATYRFGFYGITNTLGLKRVYESEYGGQAVSLDPSVDTGIFYPDENRNYDKKKYTVFFYGRPGHPRNGFELGVAALKELKQRMGDRVRIVTAGAEYDISAYGLEGILDNLGRLKIEQTGDLYRRCDAGLVMMYTRHPSYLPYEMMACGCCVVSNFNEYTKWFLKNGENSVVCEPSATSIAEAIERVLLDGEGRRKISECGARQIADANPSWEESLEKIAEFIQMKKYC